MICLKPSDSLLDLIAALRASEYQRFIIKRECHDGAPSIAKPSAFRPFESDLGLPVRVKRF